MGSDEGGAARASAEAKVNRTDSAFAWTLMLTSAVSQIECETREVRKITAGPWPRCVLRSQSGTSNSAGAVCFPSREVGLSPEVSLRIACEYPQLARIAFALRVGDQKLLWRRKRLGQDHSARCTNQLACQIDER